MDKKVLMGIEVGLMILFILVTVFIIDTSKTSGLIIISVLLLITFGVVFALEKKRETLPQESPHETLDVEENLNNTPQPQTSTPAPQAESKATIQPAPKTQPQTATIQPAPKTQSQTATIQPAPKQPIRNTPPVQPPPPVAENEEEIKSKVNIEYRWRNRYGNRN